jgi:hypothetical protein
LPGSSIRGEREERKREMEDELYGVVPCSSLAVDSIIRVGTVPKLDLFFNMYTDMHLIDKLFATLNH